MLQTLDEPRTDVERRAGRRLRPTFGTTCRIASSHGLVWDMSSVGVGLLLPFAPTPGETLPVELLADAAPRPLAIQVRVAHVRALSTGDHFVGARFVRPLAEAEVAPFLATGVDPQNPLR